MNNQTIFLVILVFILMFFVPNYYSNNYNYKASNSSIDGQSCDDNLSETVIQQEKEQEQEQDCDNNYQEIEHKMEMEMEHLHKMEMIKRMEQEIINNKKVSNKKSCNIIKSIEHESPNIKQSVKNNKCKTSNNNKKSNLIMNDENSINTINEYLETKCEENFENMGNNMEFRQERANLNEFDQSLSKSLVPDFEPSSLNITNKINSYGYETQNPWDNNFYANRGFINPLDANLYAKKIQSGLEYSY